MSDVLNPHGLQSQCNSACYGETHAVLVLGSLINNQGGPTTPDDMVQGMTPYYQDIGWRLLYCKRAETTTERVFAEVEAQSVDGPVSIDAFSTEETPVSAYPISLDDYEPWLMIVTHYAEEE